MDVCVCKNTFSLWNTWPWHHTYHHYKRNNFKGISGNECYDFDSMWRIKKFYLVVPWPLVWHCTSRHHHSTHECPYQYDQAAERKNITLIHIINYYLLINYKLSRKTMIWQFILLLLKGYKVSWVHIPVLRFHPNSFLFASPDIIYCELVKV